MILQKYNFLAITQERIPLKASREIPKVIKSPKPRKVLRFFTIGNQNYTESFITYKLHFYRKKFGNSE